MPCAPLLVVATWSVQHFSSFKWNIYSNWKSCIECHFNWPFVTIQNIAREYIFISISMYICIWAQFVNWLSHHILNFVTSSSIASYFFFNVDSFFMSSQVININFICRCWLLYEREQGRGRERAREGFRSSNCTLCLDSSSSDGCGGFACEINWDSPVDLTAVSDSKSQRGKQINTGHPAAYQ